MKWQNEKSKAGTKSREMARWLLSGVLVGAVAFLLCAGTGAVVVAEESGALASPGATLATTYWDMQQYGAMGRMIGWGVHGTSPQHMLVQFSWAHRAAPAGAFSGSYSVYDAASTWALGDAGHTGVVVTSAAFPNLAVDNLDRAWLACSPWSGSDWDWSLNRNSAVASATFTSQGSGEEAWPRIQVQMQGVDTVIHLLARTESARLYSSGDLYYYRKIGTSGGGSWTGPTILGTALGYAYDLAASRTSGKIAVVWSEGKYLYYPRGAIQGDLRYRQSTDKGLTWGGTVNITTNPAIGLRREPGHDVSALYDASGHLHIVWSGLYRQIASWPGYPRIRDYGRVSHWSDNVPVITAVHSANFAQRYCDGGAFAYNVAKATVSECNGRLYVLFVKFNDVGSGIFDDCASTPLPYFRGGANGDLFVSVSSDDGLTWDKARNLTNSYGPMCDSATAGGICYSDNWPSMVPSGTNFAGTFTGIPIVDPSGSYAGGYYLDVQYVEDHFPGSQVLGEGIMTGNPVKWFRLACVSHGTTQVPPHLWPRRIEFSAWTHHGHQLDTALTLENLSNSAQAYAVSVLDYSGPAGWLTTSALGGMLSTGVTSTTTGTIRINSGGIVNSPGTTVALSGAIRIWTSVSDDTIPIEVMVADTVQPTVADTAEASGLYLSISNDGNIGNGGNFGLGGLNLDFLGHGDLDSSAGVYLVDGSPIIGRIVGMDTIIYAAFRGHEEDVSGVWNGSHSILRRLIPTGTPTVTTTADYVKIESGKILTSDSALGMKLIWYAPIGFPDAKFIIQRTQVFLNKDQPVSGVLLGHVLSWELPSDTGNTAGFDFTRNLLYVRGTAPQTSRFGGLRNLSVTKIVGASHTDQSFWGLSVVKAESYQHPQFGIGAGRVFNQMYNAPGFTSEMGASRFYMFNCTNRSLQFDTLTETLQVDQALVSTRDAPSVPGFGSTSDTAKDWSDDMLEPNCCNGTRGNLDGDESDIVDISDLSVIVDYLFFGGAISSCVEENDVDKSGSVDISDLSVLVDFLFFGGGLQSCT